MPARLVPPLVVTEGVDVTIYSSEAELVREIEPWFANESYRAFDSEGRRVELLAHPPVVARRFIGPIRTDNAHKSVLVVQACEDQPSNADELAELLRTWLAALGVPASADMDLRELVSLASQHS
ncbi:MAG: hypothetical protein QOJ29_3368 [Thermoleophilaceae bacterium]|jgi:hypothetical protein|nr:hypothetical protein [Thermoleophilaceae bacterium]